MQNENLENQASPIRRNPSRNNTNVKQGQGYDKQRFNEESEENRSSEVHSSEHDQGQPDVDGGRVSDTNSNQGHQFSGGEATLERGFSGNQEARQVPQGSPNSGSQIQKQQTQPQPDGVSENPDKAGAGAGYEAKNNDSDSDSFPREKNSGQFNQSQDDVKRQ